MNLIESILADAAAVTTIRRDLHAHPELCFQEERTADVIAKALTDWGIPIHRGLGTTGVVGIVKNGTSDRAVGLRADIDALPMTEHNTFAHASRHPGKMHACGHDGHTAMLLAAAKHLSRHRNFDGTVYLVFQPAEEGGGGAREMIKDGLFQKFPMEAMFGAHNWPGLKVGQFSLKNGPAFASSNEFKITLRGKGSHAAMPHLGIDPVPVACQMVQAFQTIITRNKRPIDAGVISVTMIHAGEATNVVPDSCVLQGTVRTFTIEVLDMIEQRMKAVAEHTAAAFGATCTFEFKRNYPPTINHPAETEFVRRVMGDIVGPANVQEFEPTMGAEDFSYYLLEKPGCYFLIGNGEGEHREGGHGLGPCMLHNPSYDFNDDLIPLGGDIVGAAGGAMARAGTGMRPMRRALACGVLVFLGATAHGQDVAENQAFYCALRHPAKPAGYPDVLIERVGYSGTAAKAACRMADRHGLTVDDQVPCKLRPGVQGPLESMLRCVAAPADPVIDPIHSGSPDAAKLKATVGPRQTYRCKLAGQRDAPFLAVEASRWADVEAARDALGYRAVATRGSCLPSGIYEELTASMAR